MASFSGLLLILTGVLGILADENYSTEQTVYSADGNPDLSLEALARFLNFPPEASRRAYWPVNDPLHNQHQKAIFEMMNPTPIPPRMEPPVHKYILHHLHKILFLNFPFYRNGTRIEGTPLPAPHPAQAPQQPQPYQNQPTKSLKQEIIDVKTTEKKITAKSTAEKPTTVERILNKRRRMEERAKRHDFRL